MSSCNSLDCLPRVFVSFPAIILAGISSGVIIGGRISKRNSKFINIKGKMKNYEKHKKVLQEQALIF